MKLKGSITVAMSLLLLVILGLVAACIQSARISAARVKAVNGIDVGLFSLFSEYQPLLLEKYDLFFLDGGYRQGKISQAQIINQMEAYMEPVLSTGITGCKIKACSIDGYRTAAQNSGQAVQDQICRYMKKSLGNLGLEKLLEQYQGDRRTIEQQEETKKQGMEEKDLQNERPMEGISSVNNPLEILESIRKHGLLGLLIPEEREISEKTEGMAEFLSHREIQQGFGEIAGSEGSEKISEKLLLAEYILEKQGCFTERKDGTALDYQVEYILAGKDSDRENLKGTINQLLVVREVSNLAFLYTDEQKRSQLAACAAALSVAALIPQGMELVQAVLAAGWAYAESICDIRTLLAGGRIPLRKDRFSWQTQISCLDHTAEEENNGGKGLDYQGYLRLLLMARAQKTLTLRCMDLMELDIRKKPGYENFFFDSCLDRISVEILFQGPEGEIWSGKRSYRYLPEV